MSGLPPAGQQCTKCYIRHVSNTKLNLTQIPQPPGSGTVHLGTADSLVHGVNGLAGSSPLGVCVPRAVPGQAGHRGHKKGRFPEKLRDRTTGWGAAGATGGRTALRLDTAVLSPQGSSVFWDYAGLPFDHPPSTSPPGPTFQTQGPHFWRGRRQLLLRQSYQSAGNRQ